MGVFDNFFEGFHKNPNSKLKSFEEFSDYFSEKMTPILGNAISLQNRANTLTEAVQKRTKPLIIPMILSIGGFGYLFVKLLPEDQFILGIVLGLFVALLLFGGVSYFFMGGRELGKAVKAFQTEFNGIVMPCFVKFFDGSLNYSKPRGIAKSEFLKSNLFKDSITTYKGEDLIQGKIGETAITLSDIIATKKIKRGKSTTTITIFKGVMLIADFNKNFSGQTIVLPESSSSFSVSVGGFNLSGKNDNNQKYLNSNFAELVKLEDPEFEKEFMVRGTDQIEARYLLSPKLMELIMELKKKNNRKVYISFVNSKLYIGLSGIGMFEDIGVASKLTASYLKKMSDRALGAQKMDLTSAESFRNYFNDLSFFLGVVEDLDLNTRIWSK